ncbi:hypothetical protein HYPSUDRAFT_399135 [Hypholoma sublateritium FD-334 SS-4]|uniref:Uncharacterized protein n=1 Tax=Hypholoma sublateritium (strain FD-334 SS-4) TaxID=945553 RepID=A0A0D2P3G1_HYPSF|nr:hypothetical protein HYPSUDRAFT_399135 [Hypholoma sublateritium FD-334 SS-4]
MVYDNCDTFTHGDLFTFRVIAELRSSQLDYLVFSADTGGGTSLLENSAVRCSCTFRDQPTPQRSTPRLDILNGAYRTPCRRAASRVGINHIASMSSPCSHYIKHYLQFMIKYMSRKSCTYPIQTGLFELDHALRGRVNFFDSCNAEQAYPEV